VAGFYFAGDLVATSQFKDCRLRYCIARFGLRAITWLQSSHESAYDTKAMDQVSRSSHGARCAGHTSLADASIAMSA